MGFTSAGSNAENTPGDDKNLSKVVRKSHLKQDMLYLTQNKSLISIITACATLDPMLYSLHNCGT